MPTSLEAELLALIAQGSEPPSPQVKSAKDLPDLDPLMFLSEAAKREMGHSLVKVSSAPTLDLGEVELGTSWDIQESDLEGATPVADLEGMFMRRALQETNGGDFPEPPRVSGRPYEAYRTPPEARVVSVRDTRGFSVVKPPPSRSQPPEPPRVSRYERLLGPSPFDD